MTATMPPGLRECRLYRFYGWDPRTNYTTKTLIYVGETGRLAFERLMEHVSDQPWADTITSWEVDDRIFASKTEVLEAERAAIRDERPLYNYEENQANARRVPIPVAQRQRWARDDAVGRPRWIPAKLRTPPPSWWQRRPAWQVKAGLWLSAWLLLWSWLWQAVAGVGVPGGWAAGVSAVLAGGLLVWGLRRGGARISKRRRR